MDFNTLDYCLTGARVAPLDELSELMGLSLRNNFDATISKISDPAGKVKGFRFLLRMVAEAYPLYLASYK
jgi:hypothetical protein